MTIREYAEAATGKQWCDLSDQDRANWIAWGILAIGDAAAKGFA